MRNNVEEESPWKIKIQMLFLYLSLTKRLTMSQ